MRLFRNGIQPLSKEKLDKLSPERVRIAKVFSKHIDGAVSELGAGYNVTFQGGFGETPIRIIVEVTAEGGIP
jgi:hypothetical protein